MYGHKYPFRCHMVRCGCERVRVRICRCGCTCAYLRFDGKALPHVLLGSQYQLMVDEPIRLAIENCGRRVDVHGLTLNQRFVALLLILLSCVDEVATADGLAHAIPVFAA